MGRKKFRPLDCAVSVTFSLSIVTVNLLPKTFGRQYHIGVKSFLKKNPLFWVFHNSFIMNDIREIIPSHRMCKKVKKTDEPDLPNGLDKKITKQNPLKPFRKNDKIEWNFLKSISYVNICIYFRGGNYRISVFETNFVELRNSTSKLFITLICLPVPFLSYVPKQICLKIPKFLNWSL